MPNTQIEKVPLQTIDIETGDSPDAAVIWLHGLGASGDDFVPVIPELCLPAELRIRFVFPHAPQRPVTINGGMRMPAWYDILEMNIDRKVDQQQLEASADAVGDLIDREIARGIVSERIILAGFSQGGAVAYQLALSSHLKLAGIMALSTYFATTESIQLSSENASIPIIIFHGSQDPVVPELLGRQAYDQLSGLGYAAEYKTYPMDHSVCMEEIGDISQWIQDRLS